jgi:uroporphyrinogen-III synthase
VRSAEVDAAVLAAAGIERLGLDLSEFMVVYLTPSVIVPSAAQGAMAIQTREDDNTTLRWVTQLDNLAVREIVTAERELLGRFNGGCQLPLGIHVTEAKSKAGDSNWIGYAAYSSKERLGLQRATVLATTPEEATEQLWQALNLGKASRINAVLTREHINPIHEQWLAQAGIMIEMADGVEEIAKPNPNEVPLTDWVFFSSPSGVHAFFENHKLHQDVLIGAMGSGTINALKGHGIVPDYQGDSEVSEVAEEFGNQAQGKSVLFPTYEAGVERVQKALAKAGGNPINYIVGSKQSQKVALEKEHYELGLFTAASQVTSFAEQGLLARLQHFVAMGETTAAALLNEGVFPQNITISPIPSVAMLVQLACGLVPKFLRVTN